jgi:hypothetical protein
MHVDQLNVAIQHVLTLCCSWLRYQNHDTNSQPFTETELTP